jgi:hypothetical protein
MIEIRGGENLPELARELKDLGDKGLQKELSQAISRAMKPVKAAIRESARDTLPKQGQLNERVARSRISQRRNRNGLSLQAAGRRRDQLDRGILRHPVFGNRDEWVTQQVKPGWWTIPTEAAADDVRREIEQAMDGIVRKLNR